MIEYFVVRSKLEIIYVVFVCGTEKHYFKFLCNRLIETTGTLLNDEASKNKKKLNIPTEYQDYRTNND